MLKNNGYMKFMRMAGRVITVVFLFSAAGCTSPIDPAATARADAFVQGQQGTDLLRWGRLQEALLAFNKSLREHPEHPGLSFNTVCAMALLDKTDEAIAQFQLLLPREQKTFKPFLYFNLAGLYLKKAYTEHDAESLKHARKYYRKCSRLLPSWVLVRRLQEAIDDDIQFETYRFLVGVLNAPPDSARFTELSLEKGKHEKASYVFSDRSVPMLYFYHSPACYIQLGYGEKKGQRLALFLRTAVAMITARAGNDLYEKRLLFTCYSVLSSKDADLDKAVQSANRALALQLDYPVAYYYLGDAYLALGNYALARDSARRALAIDSAYEPARTLLQEIAAAEEAQK